MPSTETGHLTNDVTRHAMENSGEQARVMDVVSASDCVKTEAETTSRPETTKMNSIYVLDGITSSSRVKEESEDYIKVTDEFKAEPDAINTHDEPDTCLTAEATTERSSQRSSTACDHEEANSVADNMASQSLEDPPRHSKNSAVELHVNPVLDDSDVKPTARAERCNSEQNREIWSSANSHLSSVNSAPQCNSSQAEPALPHTGDKPFEHSECRGKNSYNSLGKKPYHCTVCGKKCYRKYQLAEHMRIHTGEKPFDCTLCGRKFSYKNSLLVHITSHTGIKPFACTVCGKTWRSKGDLNKHMVIHADKRIFECNECREVFYNKPAFSEHRASHTGEKPFNCSVCGKKFYDKSPFHRHMKYHAGIKPFECNECKKRFSNKTALAHHIRTHTGEKPFECNVCSKKYNDKSNLHSHMRTHTGEKPFDCTVCGRKFSRKASLRGHMGTHTGEKPFDCNLCGKTFSLKSSLLQHIRSHAL